VTQPYTEAELLRALVGVAEGRVVVRRFVNDFLARAPLHADADLLSDATSRLVLSVKLRVYEYTSGDWTDDGLRGEFQKIAENASDSWWPTSPDA